MAAARVHILYHFPCTDGIFSALACYLGVLCGGAGTFDAQYYPMKVFLPAAGLRRLWAASDGC